MATALVTEGTPSALQGLGRLSIVRQLIMLGALAGSIALGVGVALWSQKPGMQTLYASLEPSEAQQVVDALVQAGIEHRVDEQTGALMVPAAKVHEARMRLAEQKLPKGASPGMEMLQGERSFGTSEFIEQARYKHALEIELSRTIATITNVQSARVHLALPRQSAFVKRNQQPSASVVVQLAAGRRLQDGQAEAIAHLVAAGVPNLDSSQVRVIDGKGRLLTESDDLEGLGASRRELDYRRELEHQYINRIESILTPVVGADGVKAQVVADLDFTRTEHSRESFNPDAPALRSEQVLDERTGSQLPGGVPGALTNQPPGVGAAPQANAAEAGQGGGRAGQAGGNATAARERARLRSTRNYELDRTISHSTTPSGRLRRLSVAVVVDHQRSVGANGAVTRVARTPEQLARLTALVKDAIGFDAERGDAVNVVNAPFTEPEVFEPVPPLPLWQQAWVLDAARQAGGVVLVLLIAFGVLRPVMRNLVAREVTEREVEQARLVAQAAGSGEGQGAEHGGTPALPAARDGEARIEALRQLVNEDPRRVANVVRNWVGDDG